MKSIGLCALIASATLAGFLPSCSKSGSSGVDGMFIQTCSLGCASGQSGFQVSCAIVNTYVNKDVSVVFSQAVDPATLDSSTFHLIDINSGQVPVGTRFIDPTDPRKIVFRPSINIDLQGNASFGFTGNTTYLIVVPGIGQNDPGPFIQSTSGEPNRSRMQCEIQTNLGVTDYIPGQPTVQVLVDTIDPNTQTVSLNVPANGAQNVLQSSTIRFVFNDIMDPTTLADQVTHQPTFVSVLVDLDGMLSTTNDQVPVFGNYTINTDLASLQTVMTFTPSSGLPSAGDPATHGPPNQRKILITVPSNLTDLGGMMLANPSTAVCIPQVVLLPVTTLPDADGENFTNTVNLDVNHSGADWDAAATPDRLTRGFGGGSGRLGALNIANNETVTLNTDNTVFPISATLFGDLLTNKHPIDPTTMVGDYPANDPQQWPKITVTDGIFEFSSLSIDQTGTLKITGSKPARIFSRGTMSIFGTLDVSGASAPVHLSDQILSEPGALGGPNGGDGGAGSSRMDCGGIDGLLSPPTNVGGVGVDIVPDTDFHPDGGAGGGVGRSTSIGAPPGGLHFPMSLPTSGATQPTGMNGMFLTFTVNDPTQVPVQCWCQQRGAPGSGGTYSSDGGPGIAIAPAPPQEMDDHGFPNTPPMTPGGATFTIDAFTRRLDADAGNLRGGAGGSGGGLNLDLTTSDQSFGDACSSANNIIQDFFDNSGAAGGGGGGAVQLVSGQVMVVAGTVLAIGGAGGSSNVSADPWPPRKDSAAPGGGGSGGAVRVQGRSLLIDANPGRISVVGGAGGVNPTMGNGGAGGAGLVRLEQIGGGLDPLLEAPKILPYDMMGDPDSSSLLSIGAWTLPRMRPETYTAAVSCWMTPTLAPGQTYFTLGFIPDDLSANPATYGWNMDVIYNSGSGEHLLHYRDPAPHTDPNYPALPNGADFETFFGNMLNHGLTSHQGSYLAVRFQGAVSKGAIPDFCNVKLSGGPQEIQIVSGSLTPWVEHPAELNLFNPPPNMIRFTVVFDRSLATPNTVASFVKGVTNLKIQAKPD